MRTNALLIRLCLSCIIHWRCCTAWKLRSDNRDALYIGCTAQDTITAYAYETGYFRSYTNKDEYDEIHYKESMCNGSGGSVAAIV